jgi:DNA repair protein RecO (recombination protein O)
VSHILNRRMMSTRGAEFSDDAVVLRNYKSGEADRIAVLWTREHGKIRVLAKGSRKANSKLGGALDPLSLVRVNLVQGKGDLYVTRNVAHLQTLPTLRASYQRISAGYAVVEGVDAIPLDDVADEGIYDLLVKVMTSLDEPQFDPTLVPAAFFLKFLAYDGSEPLLEECAGCGSPGPFYAFDAGIGGVLCETCRRGTPLSSDTYSLLVRILGGDLAGVLREAEPPGGAELIHLAHAAMENHLGKRLKVARMTPTIHSVNHE